MLNVEVADHKKCDQQIKSAMEEAMLERKADKVTFKLAQERQADKPVLEGIVEKATCRSHTNFVCNHLRMVQATVLRRIRINSK